MRKTFKSKIMDFIASKGGTLQRKDIVKFIVESKGLTYNPIQHRGYYSCHFQTTTHKWLPWSGKYALCGCSIRELGYLMKSSKFEHRHLHLVSKGVYTLIN